MSIGITALYFSLLAEYASHRSGPTKAQAVSEHGMSMHGVLGFTTAFPMNWWAYQERDQGSNVTSQTERPIAK